jgi:hypothetical protein
MFGSPERYAKNGDTIIKVPINLPALGVKIYCENNKPIPDIEIQPIFDALRSKVLNELVKETKFFKVPTTIGALETVTPIWGILHNGEGFEWSPYTHIKFIDEDIIPTIIDLRLAFIEISRSTIYPEFEAIVIEQKADIAELIGCDITDFEEVVNDEQITIKDNTKKNEDKAKIRNAFRKADFMRLTALSMANIFFDTYDLSDNESTFSEWMED